MSEPRPNRDDYPDHEAYIEAYAQWWERRHNLPVGGREPAEVRRERRIRRAALLVLDGGLRIDESTRYAGIEAAAAEDALGPALHEQMLTVIRWHLRTHLDVLAVFEAALAAEEHEHNFGGGPVAAEAVANRIILLLRKVLAPAPADKLNDPQLSEAELSRLMRPDLARERLTDGIAHELMLHTGPVPDSPEGLAGLDDDGNGAP